MKQNRNGRFSPEFKLFIFSIFYGLLFINYIDLVVPGSNVPGYHAWLAVAYFISFVPLLFLWGLSKWKLVLSLGLTASLMNDLFYYPISLILFGKAPDLYEWYLFQLGFKGLTRAWTFNAGIFTLPVTSILMGVSIYIRIMLVTILSLGFSSPLPGYWITVKPRELLSRLGRLILGARG